MIVVVGSPVGRETDQGIVADGIAATIARVAAASGAEVQLVGKVGEGTTGDAVLLSLAEWNVGHVAMLRDASTLTPVAPIASEPEAVLDAPKDDVQPSGDGSAVAVTDTPLTPIVDSGDLQLALRYLPDYRVVVVADGLDDAARETVVAATRWAGAQLIVVVPSRSMVSNLPDDATILEAPAIDPDGAFATVVGGYAAALDSGVSPAEAFASASLGSGWSAVSD